jgi:hypothetical protein
MERKDDIDMDIHNSNYTIEKVNKVVSKYNNIFAGIELNISEYSGVTVRIIENIVKKIKKLRFTYCKQNKMTNTCDKKEVGGILRINDGIIDEIIEEFTGEGDTITMRPSINIKDISYHTHPDAYGIWNKASPPSEYDLLHSMDMAVNGRPQINLIWDRYGIYIYYLYPNIAKQLRGRDDLLRYREKLINIFRYSKMGFGFYYKKKDYKAHYRIDDTSSFSKYRNFLKRLGFYVDFKRYNQEILFIIPP